MVTQVHLSQEEVTKILTETGALRKGHFRLPSGMHTNHYFQMPLALRYFSYARMLSVGLSRVLRVDPHVSAVLPRCTILGAASGGIPVAFAVREALNADQIFWVERSGEKLEFRQFAGVNPGEKCILVDDITLTGKTLHQLQELVTSAGGTVIAIGVIVNPKLGPVDFGVPFYALAEIPTELYKNDKECPLCKSKVPLVEAKL